jgi:hypothetical protein
MTPEQAIAQVRPSADALSRGDIEGALALAPASRCSLADLKRVLKNHPVALGPFTDVEFESAIVMAFDNDQTGEHGFDVRLDFPALDGGLGDLTL